MSILAFTSSPKRGAEILSVFPQTNRRGEFFMLKTMFGGNQISNILRASKPRGEGKTPTAPPVEYATRRQVH
jgi:hypothetical protein